MHYFTFHTFEKPNSWLELLSLTLGQFAQVSTSLNKGTRLK